ncbi:adenylyl-sulfate kinase [Paraburkholderia sp. DD10]|jgi:adenylylsulfate kinase|uniref:Adenylyl-sulfate kinase n=2 Tax=Paraburkholderia terricola TaxID=169427 RepID=A0ABU1LLG7_9BURK|nr:MULTISPECIES: adenylyl-sulfate kinase [Paraburkholderia]ORC46604.1 adenylyl-sulfate kinase [Burkholderia sp. A27]AXE91477.1 adenylyl-sulfate kinase [Paraburkholderia terricola]MDR6407592.1 adenylylsulfate kinase [Paraburkholderia terricola]MDR6444991.1 adenylylsulfate kinase [Paraburkholderia terricola]MDR6480192.1 adenylylsulfate kinase [Paraburkholderia terricola]
MGKSHAFVQRCHGAITAEDRIRMFRQRPVTIWLTGLSGAGKSTIAFALEQQLVSLGHACYVLDGDNIRHGLARDLSFEKEDRRENIRRVAHVAQLMNDAGLIVITALISPMREDRAMAREIIGAGTFIETHLSAPVDTCARRDPKGLYAKARAGEIPSFTGVSAPYEAPVEPELRIDTATLTPDQSVAKIFDYLRENALALKLAREAAS